MYKISNIKCLCVMIKFKIVLRLNDVIKLNWIEQNTKLFVIIFHLSF